MRFVRRRSNRGHSGTPSQPPARAPPGSCYSRRRDGPRIRPPPDGRRRARRRPHRGRDLNRIRHPGLPRTPGPLDARSQGREDGDAPPLHGRSRRAQARLAEPARVCRPGRREPNAGHRAIVAARAARQAHMLITQNVDGLHQKAGSDPERVVEIHGTMREVTCMECGERAPMERALARVRAGEADPAVPDLRRHPQVRHDLVRPEPGPRRSGARRGRRGEHRPPARGRLHPQRLPHRRRRPGRQGRGRAA